MAADNSSCSGSVRACVRARVCVSVPTASDLGSQKVPVSSLASGSSIPVNLGHWQH